MAPHSSTLAWKIPWMGVPGRLRSMGSRRVGRDWATSLSLFIFMHWRRKWQPLQCSRLENPRDGGAWWAAIYGVTQSRTRLKWLSSSSKLLPMHQNTLMSINAILKFPQAVPLWAENNAPLKPFNSPFSGRHSSQKRAFYDLFLSIVSLCCVSLTSYFNLMI